MKTLSTVQHMLAQANRSCGQPTDTAPDLGPLPHLDWPGTPAVQQAVADTVSEALALRLSVSQATGLVAQTLNSVGIHLTPADLDTMVHAHALGTL